MLSDHTLPQILNPTTSTFVCVCVCVYFLYVNICEYGTCVCGLCTYMCSYLCIWGQKRTWAVRLYNSLPFSCGDSVSHWIWGRLETNKPRSLSVSGPNSTWWVTGEHDYACLFTWVLESELCSLNLHSNKHSYQLNHLSSPSALFFRQSLFTELRLWTCTHTPHTHS